MGEKLGKVVNAYQSPKLSSEFKFAIALIILISVLVVYEATTSANSMVTKFLRVSDTRKINKVLTWNIAAINNNPFEYWITSDDADYNRIMKNVSMFIEQPGVNDVKVKSVFTDAMLKDLLNDMKAIEWDGLEETKRIWHEDLKSRNIISQFIKDPLLGKTYLPI